MKVAVVKERRAYERRVAASPDTVKRMLGMGLEVVAESGAGDGACFTDAAFAAAGAAIAADAATALGDADIVLKVQRPLLGGEGGHRRTGIDEARRGADRPAGSRCRTPPMSRPMPRAGIAAFAMELVPRITRAQAMDVLSSQANLAGYKAVLDAAAEFGRAFPMMMTAAGTIKAARVLVMGAGVAGLQAIATARRLGAIVSATDVRAAAKEQVESLGATFITVDEAAARSAETAGGYAREMGEDYQRRQRERITEALKRHRHRDLHRADPRPQGAGAADRRDGRRAGAGLGHRRSRGRGRRQCRGQPTRRNRRPPRTGSRSSATSTCPRASPSMRASSTPATCWRSSPAGRQGATKLKIDTADEIVKATLLTENGAVVEPGARAAGDRRDAAAVATADGDSAMADPASLADRAGELAGDAGALAHNLDAAGPAA